MQYLTLEKESGAIQAVNMGLIGEEVELFIWITSFDSGKWKKHNCKLTYKHLDRMFYGQIKIRIPKPTIEDLREGDLIRYEVSGTVAGRSANYLKIINSVFIHNLKIRYDRGEIYNLKLITRKSEGVDVLD